MLRASTQAGDYIDESARHGPPLCVLQQQLAAGYPRLLARARAAMCIFSTSSDEDLALATAQANT